MKVIIAGKGGSGKSTVVSLVARAAVEKGRQVVVIDADESNLGLERKLNVKDSGPTLIDAVGGRRQVFDESHDAPSKELRVAVKSLMKEHSKKKLSLVQVGKIKGAGWGCGCPLGVITKEMLSYPFKKGTLVIVDAEAGVEHFGRGIDALGDLILFVVDPSHDSVELCAKAKRLADDVNVPLYAVLNKVGGDEVSKILRSELEVRGISVKAVIPYDESVFRSTMIGGDLKAEAALESINGLLDAIFKSH